MFTNNFTKDKYEDLMVKYTEEAAFDSWDRNGWGQYHSSVRFSISEGERDLLRIADEGAYQVLQDEDAKRKVFTVGFAKHMVALGTSVLGVGKNGGVPDTATPPGASMPTPPSNPTFVYRSVDANGVTQYVGLTNNMARRAAEHLLKKGISIEKVLTAVTRSDAQAVEQALINIHRLGKDGGTLLNRINSIARTNPIYADQVRKGFEMLKKIGYDGLPVLD